MVIGSVYSVQICEGKEVGRPILMRNRTQVLRVPAIVRPFWRWRKWLQDDATHQLNDREGAREQDFQIVSWPTDPDETTQCPTRNLTPGLDQMRSSGTVGLQVQPVRGSLLLEMDLLEQWPCESRCNPRRDIMRLQSADDMESNAIAQFLRHVYGFF